MSLCKLFNDLSKRVWPAIERSRQYCKSSSQGILETSITDGLLLSLSFYGRGVAVYVPSELKTGADMDLVIAGPVNAMFLNIQAKKLYRNDQYVSMNRENNLGFQADVLCSRKGFFPLYLFYNHFLDTTSTSDRVRLAGEGCTFASGHTIRAMINPGAKSANDKLSFNSVALHQNPWQSLVCPPKETPNLNIDQIAFRAVGNMVGADGAPTDIKVPEPRPLPENYRKLVDCTREGELDIEYDFERRVIIIYQE